MALSPEAEKALREPNTEVTIVVPNHEHKGRETQFGEILLVSKPQADILVGMGVVRMGKLTEAELEELRGSNPQAAKLADDMLAAATVKPPVDSESS